MTNQPTGATRFKTALYAQCPEPVADDIWQRFESLTAELAYHKEYSNFGFQCYQDRCEGALIEQTVRDREVKELNQQINALTAQLAAAQAVIDAACAHHINSHYGGPDLLCDCGICKAVEAYRGGA